MECSFSESELALSLPSSPTSPTSVTPPTTNIKLNMSSTETEEIQSVTTHLTQLLADYDENITKDQFHIIIKKMIPFINEQRIQNLFESIDEGQFGFVSKELLLKNNNLPLLIIVCSVH